MSLRSFAQKCTLQLQTLTIFCLWQVPARRGGPLPCKFCGRACEWPKLATVPEHPKDTELLAEIGVTLKLVTAKHEAELIGLCRSGGTNVAGKYRTCCTVSRHYLLLNFKLAC